MMGRKFTVSPILRQASEAAFQKTVEEAAQWYGYRTWHDNDSRKNDHGFPDLVLVGIRTKQVVFLECKKESRSARASVEQVMWLQDIRISGTHGYVIRPSNWDLIEMILRGEVDPPVDGVVDPRLAPLLENESNPKVISRARRRS